MRLASRVDRIDPFYVMEVAKTAAELSRTPMCDPAQGGRPMLYLNIGEPDETAPAPVQAAAHRVIDDGRTGYTAATGLPELRRALSGWYAHRFGLDIDPGRIIVTAGASAALQLAMLALVDFGDEVLMPDPSYPCNRHFVTAAGGQARLLATGAAERFQPTAAQVAQAWGPRTAGVLLASPSNPTGTSIDPTELAAIVGDVRRRGGWTAVDEIYLGLSYDPRYGGSALALGEDLISINSFSKTFGMTGWRLGWLVVPPDLVAPLERLAQNLYICASTVAQRAALACFEPATLQECERRREGFRRRRDYVVVELERLGWPVPVPPDGAFYTWIDTSSIAADSWDLCHQLMHHAQLTLTPGRDFGPALASQFVRLSFASSMEVLRDAMHRLASLDPQVLARPWQAATPLTDSVRMGAGSDGESGLGRRD